MEALDEPAAPVMPRPLSAEQLKQIDRIFHAEREQIPRTVIERVIVAYLVDRAQQRHPTVTGMQAVSIWSEDTDGH